MRSFQAGEVHDLSCALERSLTIHGKPSIGAIAESQKEMSEVTFICKASDLSSDITFSLGLLPVFG